MLQSSGAGWVQWGRNSEQKEVPRPRAISQGGGGPLPCELSSPRVPWQSRRWDRGGAVAQTARKYLEGRYPDEHRQVSWRSVEWSPRNWRGSLQKTAREASRAKKEAGVSGYRGFCRYNLIVCRHLTSHHPEITGPNETAFTQQLRRAARRGRLYPLSQHATAIRIYFYALLEANRAVCVTSNVRVPPN